VRELQRRHFEERGAISPSDLELDHNLSGGVGLHALVGQSGARNVAAQVLQRLAVFGTTTHGCVQAEAVEVGHVGLAQLTRRGVLVEEHSFIIRVTILCNTVCSDSSVGAGTSTKTGSPSVSHRYKPTGTKQRR